MPAAVKMNFVPAVYVMPVACPGSVMVKLFDGLAEFS